MPKNGAVKVNREHGFCISAVDQKEGSASLTGPFTFFLGKFVALISCIRGRLYGHQSPCGRCDVKFLPLLGSGPPIVQPQTVVSWSELYL
jgi:hypothetical protein